MRKLVSLIAVITLVFSFSACSKTNDNNKIDENESSSNSESVSNKTDTDNENNNNNDTSSDKDKLIIGLDENFPPMGFRDDDGDLIGFDIDLATAAGEKMGKEVVFQPIDWSSKELELNSGKVDLLWNGLTITEDRLSKMSFTSPYLKNRQVILVKEDSDIAFKSDLDGKKIGLQKESSALEAVNKDPIKDSIKEISEYPDNIAAFTDLDIGRIDAVVVDEVVARYYLENNVAPFRILDENFGNEEYGIAAKFENTELINELQKALDELSEEGTASEISINWFGNDIYQHSGR